MNKTIQEIRSLKKELENKIFELVSEFEAETTVEVPIIYVSHSKLRSTSGELVAKCITIDVQLNYDTAE